MKKNIAVFCIALLALACSKKNDAPKSLSNDNYRLSGTTWISYWDYMTDENGDTLYSYQYQIDGNDYEIRFDDTLCFAADQSGPVDVPDSNYYILKDNILYGSDFKIPADVSLDDVDDVKILAGIIEFSKNEDTIVYKDIDNHIVTRKVSVYVRK